MMNDCFNQNRMAEINAQSGQHLDSVPNYIRSLERQIESLDYKLNKIIETLDNKKPHRSEASC